MHTNRFAVAAAVVLALAAGTQVRTQGSSAEADRVAEAATVLQELQATKDTNIPKSILDKARAIAVFPSTIKGAFVVGAQRGRGVLSGRSEQGWSAPAFVTLTGGSVGFQVGGQATDIVLVVMNDRGLDNLSKNSFKLGGSASVAAGPVGREAAAGTDYKLQAEILSYSRSRGVFAGVSVNGSTIRADLDANDRVYGGKYTTRQIIVERRTSRPAAIEPLMTVLGHL